MTKTAQVISEHEVHVLLGYEPDEAVDDVIDTHDGQWQREATGWRFWLNEDTGPCP